MVKEIPGSGEVDDRAERQRILWELPMTQIADGLANVESQVASFQKQYQAIEAEVGKVIVGHTEVVRQTILCLMIGGHALLEGVPGLGKTLLVRTLAQVLDLQFSRIQFTPDLMPADIVGTSIVINEE